MAKEFTAAEWDKISTELRRDPECYGLPAREQGSVLLASFNIRKLGTRRARNQATWEFLANACFRFDLMAVQEVQDNLEGLRHLVSLMGPEFHMIVSDKTGAFPNEPGMGERLAFIYRHSVVRRTELATDIAIDRGKLFRTLEDNHEPVKTALETYSTEYDEYRRKTAEFDRASSKPKSKPKAPKLTLPDFMTFIRSPFMVSFEIGEPQAHPYRIMAINAHLLFGESHKDRWEEFQALTNWINGRVAEQDRSYYEDFILLGDLNLNFDNPATDRPQIETELKKFDQNMASGAFVNFPFIDVHPKQTEVFRTAARLEETYDQIAIFGRDDRLPDHTQNEAMGQNRRGPDYGVFNFTNLFQEALGAEPVHQMSKEARKEWFARYEHKVSDHMPIWLRLPLPH